MRAAVGSASLGARTLHNKSEVGDAVRPVCQSRITASGPLFTTKRGGTPTLPSTYQGVYSMGLRQSVAQAAALSTFHHHTTTHYSSHFHHTTRTWGRWIQNAAVHAVAHEEQNVGLFDAPHRRGQEEGPGEERERDSLPNHARVVFAKKTFSQKK